MREKHQHVTVAKLIFFPCGGKTLVAEAIHFDIWRRGHQVDIFHKRIGIQFITHNGYPVRLRLSDPLRDNLPMNETAVDAA